MPTLPKVVHVYEVGPRDGLQNEPTILATDLKVELINRLSATGLATVEASSFVRPDRVPQLGDAAEVMSGITRAPGVRYPVLVPNVRGLERATECGVTDVAVFASATESFAQRNLGCSVRESLAMFAPVVEQARASNLGVRGYVSMCFRDPWEGDVDPRKVVDVAGALVEQGCQQISLGDTIGAATGEQVTTLLAMLSDAGVGPDLLAMHFHDTYGQALANTLLSLEFGITTIDASAGGLGGCPFAKSATGNLATEELVWMLHGLGIETGVDLPALVSTSLWLAGELGRPSPSALVRAWPMENHE